MSSVDAAFRAHDAKVVDIAVREVRAARLNGLIRGFVLGLIVGLIVGALGFSARAAVAAPPPVAAPALSWPTVVVERVSWRPVPTSATRGCLFPAWVGRPHWPGCER